MKKVKKSHKLFCSLKSQGLPVNVIIIAAIALVVLVVLIAIFTGRFGIFTGGVKEAADCSATCKSLGYTYGTPQDEATDCTQYTLPGFVSDDPNNPYCCCSGK